MTNFNKYYFKRAIKLYYCKICWYHWLIDKHSKETKHEFCPKCKSPEIIGRMK